jgi:hypothetical protein
MSITAAIVAVASTVASAASAVAGAVGAAVGAVGSAIGAAVGTTAATISGLAAGVLPTVGAALTTISTISTVASFGLTVAGAITGDQSLMKAAMWTGIGGAVAGLGAAAVSAGTAAATSGTASAGNAAVGNTAELTIGSQVGQAITPAFESTAGTSINAATNAATPGLLGSAGTKALSSLSNSMGYNSIGAEYGASLGNQGVNTNAISLQPANQLPALETQFQAPDIAHEAYTSLKADNAIKAPSVSSTSLDLNAPSQTPANTSTSVEPSKFATSPTPSDTSGTVSTTATGDVQLNNFGQKGIGDYKDFVSSGFDEGAPSATNSVQNAANNVLPTATDISKQASSGLWDTVKNYGGKTLDFIQNNNTLVGTGLKMIQGAGDYSANKETQQMKMDYEQALRKQAGLRYDPIAVQNYYKNLGKFATKTV